jgi:DNA-binding NtrC family response regulator
MTGTTGNGGEWVPPPLTQVK